MEHSEASYSTVRGRLVVAGGLVALAALLGMLLLWTQGAGAQTTPSGVVDIGNPDRVFALTTDDRLLRFDGDNPGERTARKITGLRNGESLVGIDFRPSAQPPATAQQGVLYGVGDKSYIYTIDEQTGAATRGPRITADLDGDGDTERVALEGTSFGVDFNPTVDRLRIVSDNNQSLRVNVDTGALADFDMNAANGTQPDLDLQYADGDRNEGENPAVTAVAYRNSQPAAFGTTNTELYDIDARTMDLSEQFPANNGTLLTEGSLGRQIKKISGFDIVTVGVSPAGDKGYAALQPVGKDDSRFYRVNLDTGQTRGLGVIGNGTDIEGLAIPINQT